MAAKFCSGLRLFVRSTGGNLREIRHFDRFPFQKTSTWQPVCRGFASRPELIRLSHLGRLPQLLKFNSAVNSWKVPTRQFCSTTAARQQQKTDGTQQPNKDDVEMEQKRIKTIKNTKLSLFLMGVSLTSLGLFLVFYYGAPLRDEFGNEVQDEFSDLGTVSQYMKRTWKELKLWDKMIKEPSREQLLPEPLKEPYYQPPYTLVLELTGVLVHPDWTYQTGWRFKKRPAVDFFLSQVGYPAFEVVIYTSEAGFTAFPIIDNLDPNGLIMYRLFRDATNYKDGHHVKDLSKLNRDLSKLILVDWDTKSVQLQPENALIIPKWDGKDEDTDLVDLAALLKTIAASSVEDVRTVLDYYNKFPNPLEAFRENKKKLEEEQAKLEVKQTSPVDSWRGRLFGYRRHSS